MTTGINSRLTSRLRSIDWDFSGEESDSPFSTAHWHPSRFASQIPATLIGLLSEPGALVVDPFVGSGTTAVEAQRLGRRCIGLDINPISTLISGAKTVDRPAREIGKRCDRLIQDARKVLKSGENQKEYGNLNPPSGVQLEKWYREDVGRDLSVLWLYIQQYQGLEKLIARAAFSAILLPVCRETRHWGYVCDNTTPKSEDYGRDVFVQYRDRLNELTSAYERRDKEITRNNEGELNIASCYVVCGDIQKVVPDRVQGIADLIVTSPPYFGVSDYVKAQRLSMEWFGYDIEPLRLSEIGARSKRRRKAAAEEYLEEMKEALRRMVGLVKPGGVISMVIGESDSREAVVDKVVTSLENMGVQIVVQRSRRVSMQRRQVPSITNEKIVVAEKPI